MKKVRVGLLVETPEMVGGIQAAARRHGRLLGPGYEVVPICFETTRSEADWSGRRERVGQGWRVVAADLKSDNAGVSGSSTEHFRHDMRFRSFADRLVELVAEERLDVLHAFGCFHQRGLLAAFAAAKMGIPYMLSLRGVDLETRLFDEKSLPALAASVPGAAAVVCVSEDSRRLLERVLRPTAPTFVVPNSLDESDFERGPVSVPLLANAGMPVIGCFGKFRRVTGLDFLLKAFDLVNRRRPCALLLGGGLQKREVAYYNGLIESLQSSANIVRLGQVPHARVLDYMALCDVVAVPSVSDACPNKVLEAMHAGVPLVAAAAGGIPELLTHGRDALLVAPRSVEPLADALEAVLADPAAARRRAVAAKRRVAADFSPEREAARWSQAYDAALGRRRTMSRRHAAAV